MTTVELISTTTQDGVVLSGTLRRPPGTGVLNRLLHAAVDQSSAALGRSGKSFSTAELTWGLILASMASPLHTPRCNCSVLVSKAKKFIG